MAPRLCVTWLCTLTLVLPPGLALAAPPDEPAPEPEPELSPEAQADWNEAERLFRQGSARFAAANYAAAIVDFQAALELVVAHDFDPAVELGLLINLARAHRLAFEVDRDLTHLRTSLEIFKRLVRGAPEGSTERAEAAEAIPELERQIAETEAAQAEPEPEPVVVVEEKQKKPGTGLIIGGGVGLAVGAGGLGLMAFGMISGAGAKKDGEALADGGIATPEEIDDIDSRGKLGNTLAIVGGVVGGVGIAVGASLIALGVMKNRKAKSGAQAMVTPYGSRSGAGMTLELQF